MTRGIEQANGLVNVMLSQTINTEPLTIHTLRATEGLSRVAILGGGPAGVGAAWRLAHTGKARVSVIEQREYVGGNAGSFEIDQIAVDYGSHRLHPSCQPRILDDIQRLLREDLLDRPRHGRIRLRKRWIHFPLKPFDLMLSLPPSFGLGIAQDMLGKLAPASHNGGGETFASVLRSSLGRTICRDFYFPYAEKIWGLPPEELSVIQARRRVSAGSLGKMARKAIALLPGFKAPGAGRFFYPRGGFGQISRAIATAARDLGVDIRLQTTARKLSLGTPHRLELESGGSTCTIEADYIWSTIPITVLARITEPCAPANVLEASRSIQYRAMILVYLVLGQKQFTPFDAHYFPESEIKLTRLSEPKNYSGVQEPLDRTVLCGELPCMVGDEVWRLSDEDLGELVKESLARCGLPVKAPVLRVATARLPFAYPIYRNGYEQAFNTLDDWAAGLDRVLTFGRQGLFAHDNTHHALAMAYAAVDCFQESGEFDLTLWKDYRAEFAKHVVED